MFSKDSLHYEPVKLPHRSTLSDEQMHTQSTHMLAAMQRRHSVRDYSPRAVDRRVIENCIATAGTAPSGANHQPWHFVAISNPQIKHKIRLAAEEEEQRFYDGGAAVEWIKALEPIGTNADKPHLDIAPWLIIVFAQRHGELDDGSRYKNYYLPESVGIATGFLISALHNAGLCALTHTPNPMKFLNKLLNRPTSEKPNMIIAVGHPADDATVPAVAKIKKPLQEILTVYS